MLIAFYTVMKRTANVVWDGKLKDGNGKLTSESGILNNVAFSYATCFESQLGINPEELLACASAASFSMALSNELEISQLSTTRLETKASVRIEVDDGIWAIQEIDLFLKAHLGGTAALPFLIAASRAKANCPVSRLFSAKINLHTELEGQYPGSDLDADVVIYTSSYRQVNGDAKALLESKGIRYREVDLDVDTTDIAQKLRERTGSTRVPQIFIGEHYIGSYEDLIRLDADHGLKALLQPSSNPQTVGTGLFSQQTADDSMKASL